MEKFLLLSCLAVLFAGASTAGSHESEVRKKLLTNYDKTALPNILTNVSMRLTVLNIDMNEEDQTMNLDAWIAYEWQDPRMSWDLSLYPKVDRLAFSKSQVWRPDLALYNNDRTDIFDHTADTLVLVFPTGKMLHVPTAHLPASCTLDMTYWPHDEHNCTVKFGSWVHNGYTLDLINKDDGAEVEFEITERSENGLVLTRGSWEVQDTSVSRNVRLYPCCPEPYVDLTVEIIVKRFAPAFLWTVKIPAAVLALLTGALFLLPPASLEKAVVGALVLLLDMQFIVYTKDVVEHSPSHTPLIVQMVSEQLLLTLVCVFVSLIIVRLSRDPHGCSLPAALRTPLCALASCLCLCGYRKQVNGAVEGASGKAEELELAEERGMVSGEARVSKLSTDQAEWLLLGALLDRVLLLLYLLVIIIKLASYNAIL